MPLFNFFYQNLPQDMFHCVSFGLDLLHNENATCAGLELRMRADYPYNAQLFCAQKQFFPVGLCAMDGWMTCDFTSFSTVFQSYQDDGQMIMKCCVQWNPVYG